MFLKKELILNNDKLILDDKTLPGNIESISIDGELVFDEKEIPGKSGKTKIFVGFSDAKVSITIILYDKFDSNNNIVMTRYDMLKEIETIFKKVDKQGKAILYNITNKHINSRNIKTCYFDKLSSSEGKNIISVTISLTEHNPIVQKNQEQKKQTQQVQQNIKKYTDDLNIDKRRMIDYKKREVSYE